MNKLKWGLKRALLALDLQALALAVMLLAAAALWLLQVRPLEARIGEVQQTLRLTTAKAPVQTDRTREPEGQLTRFDALFPPFAELTVQLRQLFEIVESHGLAIDEAQYALTEKAGTGLRRFEVKFPVFGAYPDLRHALAEIQRTLPNVGIADIHLQRADTASPEVEAQLRFVVFVRSRA